MSDDSHEEREDHEGEGLEGEGALPSQVVIETDQVRGVDLILPAMQGDELLSMLGAEEGLEADRATPPAIPEDDAIQVPDLAPLPDIPKEPSEQVPVSPWSLDRAFFVEEATALSERQPERAALMYLEAARVGERSGDGLDQILSDLDAAIELQPDSLWLLPRARRTAMRLRSYDRALRIGRREILSGESHRCAAVLVEAAAVIRYHSGDANMALEQVQEALKIKPGHIPALARVVGLSGELQQHEESAGALDQLGSCLTAAKQRALCFYGAATLRETALDDTPAALSAYVRATEADPQNVPAVLALAELYASTENWPLFCRTFEHLADLVDEPLLRARLLFEAGIVQLDQNDDLEAATRDLERASQAHPMHGVALQRLADAYEAKGQARQAVETRHQMVQRTAEEDEDDEGRAALQTRIGDLHVSLQDGDRAIDAYRRALEIVPGYPPALQSLDVLYRQHEDWESLTAIMGSDAETQLPAGVRAARYVELAEILAQRLSRPDEAINAYRAALELSEGMHVAFWGAAKLLRQNERYEELVELLARQAAVSTDIRTRSQLALERARVAAGPLEAPEQAADALLEVDRTTEMPSIFFELINLCDLTGRHGDLVSLLLEFAELTNDDNEAANARVRSAGILESKLDEHDRALEILREVIEVEPTNPAALLGAVRILQRQQSWTDLVKLHHHQLSNDPDRADASLLLYRMGRILGEEVSNGKAAVSAFVKAVRTDPAFSPAVLALQALAPAEGRFEELAQVLEQFAKSKNGVVAAAALARAGEIASWRLDDLERAAGLFEQACQQHAGLAAPGLLRVRLRQKKYADVVGVLDGMIERADSEIERSLLQLQQARLKEFRLTERPDLTLYQRAASGPFGDRLREELVRVNRLTVSEGGGNQDMARQLVDLGRETIDETLAAAYMLEAAHILEFGGGGGGGALLLEAATLAYKREPQDLANIWCLERELHRRQMWAEFADLAEREAQLELDRTLRVQRLSSAADAYFRAELHDEAERVCRECLNFDAHCLPALSLLAELASRRERWRELAELCDRLGEACVETQNRLRFCLSAAELWHERVEDTSRALASLSVTLADDPGQPVAFERAEKLLAGRGDFEELSRLHQRRIRACRDDIDRIELLRRHARILRDHRRLVDRAIAELNELLKLAPADVDARREIAELHEQQGHWSDAAVALGRLAEYADEQTQYEARVKQSRILLERLHESKRAQTVLAELAELRPDDTEVAHLRARAALGRGDWNEARSLLTAVVDSSSDVSVKIWGMLKLSELTDSGEEADKYLNDVVRLAADQQKARLVLIEHVDSATDPPKLLSNIENALSDVGGSELGLMVAKKWIALEQPTRAILNLRRLASQDPCAEPSVLLAQLLEQQGERVEAVKRYRIMIDTNPKSPEGYRGLSRCGSPHIALSAGALGEYLAAEGDDAHAALRKSDSLYDRPIQRLSPSDLTLELDLDSSRETLTRALHLAAPYLRDLFEGGQVVSMDHPAAVAAAPLAQMLGLAAPQIEIIGGEDAASSAVLTDTPILRLPENVALVPTSALFRLGVGRALAGALHAGAFELSPPRFALLLEAIGDSRPASTEGQRLKKTLSSGMPRKVRKQLEQLRLANVGAQSRRQFLEAVERFADRIGMLLSGHAGVAIGELARMSGPDSQRLQELMHFAVSEAWEEVAGRIWAKPA